ncbi:MAG: hypothetical protein KME42_08215 [Tildeniella nuda ZEHNDER 1965/U140]|nr:hypothetical protein [Tildeniella nuda ZEHNDER 1965/U140]
MNIALSSLLLFDGKIQPDDKNLWRVPICNPIVIGQNALLVTAFEPF